MTEGTDEALPESFTHKTVGDRVGTGGYKRQEVDKVHGHRGYVINGAEGVKHQPSLEDIQWGPADEELKDDGEEHLDGSPLGADAATRHLMTSVDPLDAPRFTTAVAPTGVTTNSTAGVSKEATSLTYYVSFGYTTTLYSPSPDSNDHSVGSQLCCRAVNDYITTVVVRFCFFESRQVSHFCDNKHSQL